MTKYGRNTQNPWDVSKGFFITNIIMEPKATRAFTTWRDADPSDEALHVREAWRESENVTLNLQANLDLVAFFKPVLNGIDAGLGDRVEKRYMDIYAEINDEVNPAPPAPEPPPSPINEYIVAAADVVSSGNVNGWLVEVDAKDLLWVEDRMRAYDNTRHHIIRLRGTLPSPAVAYSDDYWNDPEGGAA